MRTHSSPGFSWLDLKHPMLTFNFMPGTYATEGLHVVKDVMMKNVDANVAAGDLAS